MTISKLIHLKNTFKKSERLTSKSIMESVFAQGTTLKKFPLIAKYKQVEFEDQVPIKVVVSIPKRLVKKAVDRNRVRRQIKEAYRLDRTDLKNNLANNKISLALFFIYTGKENPLYSEIEEKIHLLLNEINKTIVEANQQTE